MVGMLKSWGNFVGEGKQEELTRSMKVVDVTVTVLQAMQEAFGVIAATVDIRERASAILTSQHMHYN